jgi:uncharacterized protein
MTDETSNQESNPWENDPFAAAYPETEEFWRAAAEGTLVLRTCDDCGKAHWYPRAVCPMCGSTKLTWSPASGRGTIYAFSPARRAKPVYTLAYVTLDEGPRLMTNVVNAAPESLQIDQPVRVSFQAADEGRMMPFFEPV